MSSVRQWGVSEPEVCATCQGYGLVGVVLAYDCPDCTCPCGAHSPGGFLCPDCAAADFDDDDWRHKVTEGSR